MPEVILGGGRHAASFERRSGRSRRRVVNDCIGSVRSVVEEVGQALPLPEKIEVRFGSRLKLGRHNLGTAYRGVVYFCENVYFDYLGNDNVLLGLAAHELGHVIDYESGNDCNGALYMNAVVSEGKAENLARLYGGEQYVEALCDKGISTNDDFLEMFAAAFLRGRGEVLDEEFTSEFYRLSRDFVYTALVKKDSDIVRAYQESTRYFTNAVADVFEKPDIGVS